MNNKTSHIERTSGSGKQHLWYRYGPDGQRVQKKAVEEGTSDTTYTWYLRDASGNIMATYTLDISEEPRLDIAEHHLYGSSRLGYVLRNKPVEELVYNEEPNTEAPYEYDTVGRTLGYKYYELTNHLGNVLVVITDQKIPVVEQSDNPAGEPILYWLPNVVRAQDYYPFGMLQPGRYWGEEYRFGFNGMEQDNEVKGSGNAISFTHRLHDPRLGRFLSPDPLIVGGQLYPWYSPYQFAGNKTIQAIDLEGLQEKIVVHYLDQNGNTTKIEKITYKNVEDYGPLGNGTYTVHLKTNGTFTESYKPNEGNSIPSFGASNVSNERWSGQGKHMGFETRLNARLIEKTVENALIVMGHEESSVRSDVSILQSDDANWRGKFATFGEGTADNYTSDWTPRNFGKFYDLYNPHGSKKAIGSGEINATGLELKLYDGAASETIPNHVGFSKVGGSHFSDFRKGVTGGNPGLDNAKQFKEETETP